MKEFDYEKAKAGAPVCTRDGRPARIIFWDAYAKLYDYRFPIVALIDDDVDGEVAQTYTTYGRMYPPEVRDDDLMMATVKREGWVLIDSDEYDRKPCLKGRATMPYIYHSKEVAEQDAIDNNLRHISVGHIEWEEEQ